MPSALIGVLVALGAILVGLLPAAVSDAGAPSTAHIYTYDPAPSFAHEAERTVWTPVVLPALPDAARTRLEGLQAGLRHFAVAAEAATGAGRIPVGPGTEKAWNVLARVNAKGSPMPGYKGGSVFENAAGRLPGVDGAGNPISYREWDVNPYTKGVDRGPERVVTGSDGSAYFTGDHYDSFLQFWGPGG